MKGNVMGYSVGQVARLAGVTTRLLHHYDEIGLLSPRTRSVAGYRQYSDTDLERLQQILGYRELGFALEEIATILDDPYVDALAHLRRQHALLTERVERLGRMVAAIEHTMEAYEMGISLTPEERLEVFGDFDPDAHAQEARQRWGDTDAFRESQRRSSSYTKQDWEEITAEARDIERRMAASMTAGEAADSTAAMDLAEAHRQHISRWFYDCSVDMHRGLARMYVDDPRFTAHYDDIAAGLAHYVRDAVEANADRAANG